MTSWAPKDEQDTEEQKGTGEEEREERGGLPGGGKTVTGERQGCAPSQTTALPQLNNRQTGRVVPKLHWPQNHLGLFHNSRVLGSASSEGGCSSPHFANLKTPQGFLPALKFYDFMVLPWTCGSLPTRKAHYPPQRGVLDRCVPVQSLQEQERPPSRKELGCLPTLRALHESCCLMVMLLFLVFIQSLMPVV